MEETLKQQLILDCLDLLVGETSRQIPCPFCKRAEGGFAITRDNEGLVYNCFHASCGEYGFISTSNNYLDSSESKVRKKEDYKFTWDTCDLTNDQWLTLDRKYHLHKSILLGERWKWCPELGRLVMPIFSDERKQTGTMVRYIPELCDKVVPFDTNKKAKMYWENKEDIHLHFPLCEDKFKRDKDGDLIYVLVEDIPSAISIQSAGMKSIALLGTDIPKKDINWFYNKSVVFALDNDATYKSLQYQARYNILFKQCQVIHLPPKLDPKDMTFKEVYKHVVDKINM